MRFTYPKNPAPVIGRKGEPGWPELRGEIHTRGNGVGGYLSDNDTLINADGTTSWQWRVRVNDKDYATTDDTAFYPMVVFLPHGRYLAGWTMGRHMIASVPTLDVYNDRNDAWQAAYASADAAADAAAETEVAYRLTTCSYCGGSNADPEEEYCSDTCFDAAEAEGSVKL